VPLGKQDSLDAMRDEGGPLGDIVADTLEQSPEATHARHELVELLTAGIARHPLLSQQSKVVIIRGYLNDWDDGMLAGLLGTSRSNVHTIRSRDLAHLRSDPEFLRLLDEYLKE
jgi:DNA-directed RNA polymerase sigma subunit (sigma70/sigma32)